MVKLKRKGKELATVYAVGSLGYSLLEILWRGFTHWTMTITGGVVLVLLYLMNAQMHNARWWERCLAGAGVITGVEFVVGCIVNRLLQMNVWDYSNMPFHLLGQICPLYSLLWFGLCIPIGRLTTFLKRKLA